MLQTSCVHLKTPLLQFAGPDITYFLDAVFHSGQDSSMQSNGFAAPRVPGLMQTQEQ